MQITEIKARGHLFTIKNFGWDLNIYLITGKKYNYIIDTGLGSNYINPVLEYIKNDPKRTKQKVFQTWLEKITPLAD